MNHTALRNKILVALSRPDCRVIAINAMVARNPKTRQVVRSVEKGTPDLLALLSNGRFLWIEVKTGQGRLTPEQRNFRDRIVDLAGEPHHVVARSVEDAVAAVEAIS